MKNQLAAYYYELLLSTDDVFRAKYQSLYAAVRDALALELGEDAETIQNVFEKLASK